MHTFKLESFPIEQIRNLQILEWRFGQWFAGCTYPVRLVATSRRFDMHAPIQQIAHAQSDLLRLARAARPLISAIDRLLAGDTQCDPRAAIAALSAAEQTVLRDVFDAAPALQDLLVSQSRTEADPLAPAEQVDAWVAIANALSSLLWSLPWQHEMIRFYQALGEQHIRAIDHYLLTWEPPTISAQALAAQLRHTFGRDVQIIDGMPPIVACRYTPEATRLLPDEPGYPYYTILISYELRGTWDAQTLHHLLDVPFDVSVLVDVQTISRHRAMRMAETAHAAAKIVQRDDTLIDPRAQRVFADSEHMMQTLTHETLHLVTIAVLVAGETADALDDHVAELMSRSGTTLRLTRVAGVQDELIKLWSTTPTTRLDAPLKPWNMLSHGVGCCAGVLGYHRARETRGLLWGLDAVRRAPLFHDPFRENQAAHMCILGKTGFGKTWFLNQITLRAAAIAGWKVIGLDAERNGERIDRAAGMGAHCNWIGLEQAVNILDVVFDDEIDGGWRANQVQHVIDQLGVVPGEPGVNTDGDETLVARRFSIAERGLLDRALSDLYLQVDPSAPLNAMPLLDDLILHLEVLGEAESDRLARDLRLFLSDSLARSFNAHTTVDWNFSCDINYFDFSRVPKLLRAFYYGQAVGAINRYMRDPRRDCRRPTLLLIDEYHLVARTESVARLAAELAKVARKYKLAVVPVDQNPTTFLDNRWGLYIWENSSGKVAFHLDDLPAQRLSAAVADLTPEHVAFLTHAQPGEALMIFGNDVYVAQIETNPKETRAFAGS